MKNSKRIASPQRTMKRQWNTERSLTYAPSGVTLLGRGHALRQAMLDESALLASMGNLITAQYLRDAAEALPIGSFERMAK